MTNPNDNVRLVVYGHHGCGLALRLEEALKNGGVDRLMIQEYGISLIQMMENAGRNLAELARRMVNGQLAGRWVVVLCGAGNNGGGGMAAARHLHNRGADVRVKFVGDPARLRNTPAHQWRTLQAMGLAANDDSDLTQADLIVNALIGYGLTGDPRGPAAEWIERANAALSWTLAIRWHSTVHRRSA